MKIKIILAIIVSTFTISINSFSAGPVGRISVGTATVKKTNLAIPQAKVLSGSQGDTQSVGRKIRDKINENMDFLGMFKLIGESAFLEDSKSSGITLDSFKMSNWSAINAEYLIKMGVMITGSQVSVETYLYEVFTSKQILGKKYIGKINDPRVIANAISGDIYNALTGLPSIFNSRIAFVSNKTGNKEIWVMDFDGFNKKQITNHKGTCLSPAWSPDGTKLLYSVYTIRNRIKNLDLYMYDFTTGKTSILVNRKTHNTGAQWSPDGSKVAVSMDISGTLKIYLLDPLTMKMVKATNQSSSNIAEVDPSWSPDGRKMAFTTDIPGKPMVYIMNSDGTGVQRVTYAGTENTAPSWSPTNSKIAFAGKIDKTFDLFIMNPDGTNIERLTKQQGSNEDPSFAPDGQFIAYSSTRAGQANIYVTNTDATIDRRMTFNMGNCTEPSWTFK